MKFECSIVCSFEDMTMKRNKPMSVSLLFEIVQIKLLSVAKFEIMISKFFSIQKTGLRIMTKQCVKYSYLFNNCRSDPWLNICCFLINDTLKIKTELLQISKILKSNIF